MINSTFLTKINHISNFISNGLQSVSLKCCSIIEAARLSLVVPGHLLPFYFVSSERNVGQATIKCLDSVYSQFYPRNLVRHIFIDDASTDTTNDLILEWLRNHPDNNVNYIRNHQRTGGCANNLAGFRIAPPGSIICELNGDDWLPDPGVISYLNKVYQNPHVWMTYNTAKTKQGRLVKPVPISKDIIRNNSYREKASFGRHLHTFRQELFTHLKEESLIDPDTGEYFISGDDKAFYLSLQELAGWHSRHLYRFTYIYNYSGIDPEYGDLEDQHLRTERILHMPKYKPLDTLLYADSDKL